ncbi:MAG: hypothetical protein Q9N02_08080 [Ghiorsea sp.]|nr:hypothetical protein [Ghiorsea sp.]
MRSFNMNKLVMMSLMVMITVLGLGKISLPFLQQYQAESEVVTILDMTVESVNQPSLVILEGDKGNAPVVKSESVEVKSWAMQFINQDMIPSLEAAEQMSLKEERDVSLQDTSTLLALREQKKALTQREKELEEREAIVKEAEHRAEDKITELLQLEARIQSMLAEEQSIKDKKIKRLTAVYEGMKADRAAPVIAQMNLGIVVKIFSRMSEKQVGKILSFLKPKQAVVISQALTECIASVK